MNKNENKITLKKSSLKNRLRLNWQLYIFLIPALLYILIYRYGAMAGLQLAFKQYQVKSGIWGSPWIGFDHFKRLFAYYRFKDIFFNTFALAFYKLLAGFPLPIILALCLNDIKGKGMKKSIQTLTLAPYFISVVVVVGMTMQLFSPHYGILAKFVQLFTGEVNDIMSDPRNFRHIFVWTDIWQLTGYQAILYLAALTAVPAELHEAAMVDGAGKLKRILNIDLPSIIPTAVILFILEMGRVMDISFEKVILLQNPLNLRTSEVLTTYVYKTGILEGNFDFATAGTLFNSLINLVLVLSVNTIARKTGETSLW